MAEEERRSKRSRFDQTEPEPRKASRFDRRSRSPSARQADSRRSRSPLTKESRSPPVADPAAAAGQTLLSCALPEKYVWLTTKSTAAAAAKINAELQSRRGIQHVDVPPIRSVSLTSFCLMNPCAVLILTVPCRRKAPSPKMLRIPRAKASANSKPTCTNRMVTTSKILKSTISGIGTR